MTLSLRNTQPFPFSVPHEIRDVDGCPFVLRPSGQPGDSRIVDDVYRNHPKLSASFKAGWLEAVPLPAPDSEAPVASTPVSAVTEPPRSALLLLPTPLPTVEEFLANNLSRAASDLLWAEAFVSAVFSAHQVPLADARSVLQSLVSGYGNTEVLKELRRIPVTNLVEPPKEDLVPNATPNTRPHTDPGTPTPAPSAPVDPPSAPVEPISVPDSTVVADSPAANDVTPVTTAPVPAAPVPAVAGRTAGRAHARASRRPA